MVLLQNATLQGSQVNTSALKEFDYSGFSTTMSQIVPWQTARGDHAASSRTSPLHVAALQTENHALRGNGLASQQRVKVNFLTVLRSFTLLGFMLFSVVNSDDRATLKKPFRS